MREVEVYDWNPEGSELLRSSNFRLLDTTLRDGVQTPGIRQPSLKEKFAIIDHDAQVGIEAIDVCLPSDPSTRYFQEGVECAQYIREKYPQIEIVVLTRTMPEDVEGTLLFAEQAGIKLSSILFRGSSDLRLLAEDWQEKNIIEDMYKFSRQLTENGHKVISATEDSTRTRPEFLKDIFHAGKDGGATEFCLADTVGFADPVGVANQVSWLRKEIAGSDGLQIQFHGHDDTRNSVSNSIAAIEASANTIHVTWLGVGERAGNTPIEGILSDLERRGAAGKYDLSNVVNGANLVASAFNIPIPRNHPLVGDVVFKFESGIHAAAIRKARQQGLDGVEGTVYSAVDPKIVGRDHEVAIGPLGGSHSVRWVYEDMGLEEMGIEYSDDLEDKLLTAARDFNRALTEREVLEVARKLKVKEDTK